MGLERLLAWANPNIIFDFDDSIYMLDPDAQRPGPIATLKSWAKRREFERILRISKSVVTDSSHLLSVAQPHCPDGHIIRGPIDTVRYSPVIREPNGKPVIGWIGSPSTAPYLALIIPILTQLAAHTPFTLKLIGAGRLEFPGLDVCLVPWDMETEVFELATFDIGVMPMPVTEWTKGKMGYKLLQYMAMGIPSVVSDTTTSAEVLEHGVNGFLAGDSQGWTEALGRLLADPDLRASVGAAGRDTALRDFSLAANAPRLERILRGVSTEL